jgi:hypothetical protein
MGLGAAALTALVFAVIGGRAPATAHHGWAPCSGVSLLAAAAFGWRERRALHPLLDLRFLRVPQFVTANVAAFCSYFATFATFSMRRRPAVSRPAASRPGAAGMARWSVRSSRRRRPVMP